LASPEQRLNFAQRLNFEQRLDLEQQLASFAKLNVPWLA
jgi:hypothetical protein